MAGDGPAILFQARQKAPAIHIKAALSSRFIEALSRIKNVQFISAVATDCSSFTSASAQPSRASSCTE